MAKTLRSAESTRYKYRPDCPASPQEQAESLITCPTLTWVRKIFDALPISRPGVRRLEGGDDHGKLSFFPLFSTLTIACAQTMSPNEAFFRFFLKSPDPDLIIVRRPDVIWWLFHFCCSESPGLLLVPHVTTVTMMTWPPSRPMAHMHGRAKKEHIRARQISWKLQALIRRGKGGGDGD